MGFSRAVAFGLLAASIGLASCEAPPAEEAAAPETVALPSGHIKLTDDQTARMGVRTAVLATATYEERVQGFGVVVRFDALAEAAAQVETSQAAVRQSASALDRAKRLNNAHFVSGEALDAAQKQAATDRTQLALAQRKESVTFGRAAPWRTPGERDAVLASLAKGERALVRVTFPSDEVGAEPPATIDVQRLSGAGMQSALRAEAAWAAPADATMPGRSFFALVKGGSVAEGERLLAFAGAGESVAGVIVPESALVMSEGQMWCYVGEGRGAFVRRAVSTKRPAGGGYFVSEGFKAGESVVTEGQSLLLAFEINPDGGEEE